MQNTISSIPFKDLLLKTFYFQKPVHVPPELAAKILVAVQKCQPETGIDVNGLLMLYDGQYREDQQFKDFIYCSYKSAGFIRSDGQLNQDKALKAFNNEPLLEEGIRRCGSERGENPKESLFKFFKCIVNTTPVKIVL